MALKAGYYGLKRRVKNKLLYLLDSVPADISPDNPIVGKNDVLTSIGLLDDTVGWTGKSKVPNTASSTSVGNVAFTVNENKTVRVVSSNNSAYQALTINSNIGSYLEVGETYTLCGTPLKPSGATYRQFELRIRKNSNNDVVVSDVGNAIEFTYTQEMAQADTYRLDIAIFDSTTCDVLFAPMIIKSEQYKLSPAYEPYHESVVEILGVKSGSIVDGTGVTQYAAWSFTFKMGNLVLFQYRFTVGSENISVAETVIGDLGIKPIRNDNIYQFVDRFGETSPVLLAVNNQGKVVLVSSFTLLAGKTYVGSGMFMINPTASANREISPEPEVKATKKATKK